jgi:CubicO group peptidase (beta-lactamase class C family)
MKRCTALLAAAVAFAAPASAQTREQLRAAADYSASHNGHAVLVQVDGKIVFERYDNGHSADKPHNLYSGTKTFWGPVIAALIEDGLVTSLDEPVAGTNTEWKADARKSRITIRHLLDLNAGLAQDIRNLQGEGRPTLAVDLYQHAITVRTVTEPGARFVYGPSSYYVLGEVMKRKLTARKQTPLQYLEQRILTPIGARVGNWAHDKAGNPHIPNGAYLTARDWLKFGELLLNRGKYQDRQIVRQDLLQFAGSKANPGYGFTAWLNQPGGRSSSGRGATSNPGDKGGWIYPAGLPDIYMAAGAGGQRLYIIPSRRTVIVRFGQSPSFIDREFLARLLASQS